MGWDKDSSLPYEMEDLELIGDYQFVVGVPHSMPPEFKRSVFGAAKSYVIGHKSIDYTIKQYGNYWNIDKEKDKAEDYLLSLCSMVRENATKTINYLLSIENKPDLPNLFACSAAILRLKNSFQGAVLCVRNCLHFEAVAISRIILEQLSWIYSICRMNEDFDEYTKLPPHKSIGRLKEIIPAAGRGYGVLSRKGHILFEETLRYVKVANGELGIQLHDYVLSSQDAVNLLILCDWLGIIGEYAYHDLLQKPQFIRLGNKGQIEANPNREFNSVIDEGEFLAQKIRDIKAK